MKHLYVFKMETIATDYGIGTYLKQVTGCFFMENDIKVTIVNMMASNKELAIESMDNLRNIFIPAPKTSSSRLIQLTEMDKYCFVTACLLKEYISEEDENVFHFNFYQQERLVIILKEMYPEARTIFTIHYNNQHPVMKSDDKGVHESEYLPAEGEKTELERIMSEVDQTICLSHYTYRFLVNHKYPMDKVVCVFNGLKDEYKKMDTERRYAVRKQMGIGSNDKIFLFVGRLVESKGVIYLIQAFKKIISFYPQIHLLIVGDGDFGTCLSEIHPCYGRINLTGKISKKKLYKLYQISDVGVHPSLDEQCSYVAIEMMMHRLPIIGTNTTGMDEMIVDGYNGYKLFITEDKGKDCSFLTEKLCQCIVKCIENESLWEQLGKQGRFLYQKSYSLESMKSRMFQIYFCYV